ncbi:Rv2578c family radical SAM protein [Williamsia sp. 1135]|uniref:Rv2578c family radical SAM protein n=1 Tax=Williamsia sp. 1135 TaxID=1889262 RepID=UPI000A109262|nr:Rv2578c family radical SAM protein [Williamsia sp. 1135]ORM26017.1 radical SAM protein [Williamsia sp. 1135]
MRWDAQLLESEKDSGEDFARPALPGLERAGLVRSVQTPEFSGVTFHEVLCKSALNKVPEGSRVPMRWTINPTRGCLHQCVYCFARGSHEYLDLDAGRDFDTQIVVKVNIAAVLRKELGRRSWKRETVALGTNTDPYHRAEGRYRLMPGIIGALADHGTPMSILTKGTLLRRDLPLLSVAAQSVPVTIGISLALLDEELRRQVEPGAPSARARLDLITAVREAGFDCHVMASPILPALKDSRAELDELFGALAAAGATSVTASELFLRGPTRNWYLTWLGDNHPALLRTYRRIYGRGSHPAPEYRQWLRERITPLLEKHGLNGMGYDEIHVPRNQVATAQPPVQPTLF